MTGKEECLARAVAGGEQPAKTRAEQLLSLLVREGLELRDAERLWLHSLVKAASPDFNKPPVRTRPFEVQALCLLRSQRPFGWDRKGRRP